MSANELCHGQEKAAYVVSGIIPSSPLAYTRWWFYFLVDNILCIRHGEGFFSQQEVTQLNQ